MAIDVLGTETAPAHRTEPAGAPRTAPAPAHRTGAPVRANEHVNGHAPGAPAPVRTAAPAAPADGAHRTTPGAPAHQRTAESAPRTAPAHQPDAPAGAPRTAPERTGAPAEAHRADADSHRHGAEAHRPAPAAVTHLNTAEEEAALRKDIARTYKIANVFMIFVILANVIGQIQGAHDTWKMAWEIAVPGLAGIELGGIFFAKFADVRRRLNEPAIATRLVSAGVAAAAVTINCLTHPTLEAVAFATLGVLGYATYVLVSGAKRRDRLRAIGQVRATTPDYGMWFSLTHPVLVGRARLVAGEAAERGVQLGRFASLAIAQEQLDHDAQDKALMKIIGSKLKQGLGDLGPHVYNPREVVTEIRSKIDNKALAHSIMDQTGVERAAAAATKRTSRARGRHQDTDSAPERTAETAPPAAPATAETAPAAEQHRPETAPAQRTAPTDDDDTQQMDMAEHFAGDATPIGKGNDNRRATLKAIRDAVAADAFSSWEDVRTALATKGHPLSSKEIGRRTGFAYRRIVGALEHADELLPWGSYTPARQEVAV